MTSAPYQSTGSLTFKGRQFYLDGKPFRVISGTIHYFRVHPEYWRDRLLKLKACGLNTVETYVPWNQHEEYPGVFRFEHYLDLRKFIQVAQDVGLYVIFRPGPYICAEWDFGGLPAWLLADDGMKVRSNYLPYKEAVERFFANIIPLVIDLQHLNGGPIIAFQVENEFGSYSDEIDHLLFIKELLSRHGVRELLLTSENILGLERGQFYQHALPTGNFPEMGDGQKIFDKIKSWSPDFPLMVTEFWTGWFDHWGSGHKGLALQAFEDCLNGIIDAGASFNMYMFHGGTNNAFMAGANKFPGSTYKPDVTSYDYDAPLSEAGDVTQKYMRAREIILTKILRPQGILSLPNVPSNTTKADYGHLDVFEYLPLQSILKHVKPITCLDPLPMEKLQIANGVGQNHGYILYLATVGPGKILTFQNRPQDRAQIFVNGSIQAVLDWTSDDTMKNIDIRAEKERNELMIIVENHGRVNYIEFGLNLLNEQRKGICGSVHVDEDLIQNWTIYPLEFRSGDIKNLQSSTEWTSETSSVPTMVRFCLDINTSPHDTFLNMKEWKKGIAFVNGFNLGRYWSLGPQQTLYIPKYLLREGKNEFLLFEQEKVGGNVTLQQSPILEDVDTSKL